MVMCYVMLIVHFFSISLLLDYVCKLVVEVAAIYGNDGTVLKNGTVSGSGWRCFALGLTAAP